MYEDLKSKLLKGSSRPRTCTSGAVDPPKKGLQEADTTSTRAYVSFLPLFSSQGLSFAGDGTGDA